MAELNVTAFRVELHRGRFPETMGNDFIDASNVRYLGMLCYPVIIYKADPGKLRNLYQKAVTRGLHIEIYTKKLFETMNETDNLSAISQFREDEQDYVDLVFYGDRRHIDKVLKGQKLHP